MGCYRTVIPRTSTDKAGYNLIDICPHGHPRTQLVHFHHFQFPRTTGHGHPRSAFGSHGQPRTTAFCQNSQTFCESGHGTMPAFSILERAQDPRRILPGIASARPRRLSDSPCGILAQEEERGKFLR